MLSTRRLWIWAVVLALAACVVPWPKTVAPEWEIRVVDSHGIPARGVLVRESSRDFTLERRDRERDLVTDSNGVVRFERRTVWASAAAYAYGIVRALIQGGADASFGVAVRAYIVRDDSAQWVKPPAGERDAAVQTQVILEQRPGPKP